MNTLMSFEEALEQASSYSKKHLLLGNGFSRACRNDIFAYERLFERAKESGLSSTAEAAFEALETQDFEIVMRTLQQASKVIEIDGKSRPALRNLLLSDAKILKDLLARTIAASHPDRPSDISSNQYEACRSFLSNFANKYTLNYDLLLYWALMQDEVKPGIAFDDGFRQPECGPADYVCWDVEKTDGQNVFYLHGALHVFDAGHEIQKFTWSKTNIALIDQIRKALDSDRFPLFVAEGTYQSKMERIQHSSFLGRGLRSIAKIHGALFIYGHSLAENDEHILRIIEKSKLKCICVGIYGDPSTPDNRRIALRAKQFKNVQHLSRTVIMFDAATVRVWG